MKELTTSYQHQKLIDQETNKEHNDKIYKDICSSNARSKRSTKDSNYKFDGKVVSISKANFNKVGKDYKNATPGQERMVILDPKTHGTISAPVKFTEDYEVSMAIGQLRTINEYRVGKLMDFQYSEAKGSDYNIEAWVTI